MKKNNSVLEIDLNAISHNVEVLQSYVGDGIQHLAVVKANAYGHGAVDVAKKIAPQVDWFAVNNVKEGIELRENGINHPILVFMPPEAHTNQYYPAYDLTVSLSAKNHFNLLEKGTNYHLLFDTGMGRLGFDIDEVREVLKLKNKFTGLNCTGLYSHFATADDPKTNNLATQLQSFNDIRSQFEPQLFSHLCNTGGIIQSSDAHFNMVRSGIGIYGFGPGRVDIPGLRPAMRWKSYLAQVKPIQKGKVVSYGSTWQCPEDGYLGIIPVGFEDGLPRRLSGNLQVKIRDDYYSTAGIITMNYTMVYLQKKQFEPGTEVLLLGDKYSARDWANVVGTIPYEIMTRISPVIPRENIG